MQVPVSVVITYLNLMVTSFSIICIIRRCAGYLTAKVGRAAAMAVGGSLLLMQVIVYITRVMRATSEII